MERTMIAYLIAFVTFTNNSIWGMDIGHVHHLLNVLAGTMSEPTTPQPITLIKTEANSSQVDYDELVKLANLVCEHDIGLDLITEDGCTVIEEIAAHFLASMGVTIRSPQGSIGRSLSGLSYNLDNERYYYSQHHDVFPLVCTYARNENFNWRPNVRMRLFFTRTACDMLDRTVEHYIYRFDPGNLEKMLSKKTGIKYPDVPKVQVTYKQIGMMIPRKCQQMTSMYPRNSAPPVCTLLQEKTLYLLTNISRYLLSNPTMDKVTLINRVNDYHEVKVFHARHYIQKTCEQGKDEENTRIVLACEVILTEHPEVMIPPHN